MSNRNNTQRRVARRFKRTQRATVHHQRGSVEGETVVVIGGVALLVFCLVTFIVWACLAENRAVKACEAQGGIYAYAGRGGQDMCIRRDAVILPSTGRIDLSVPTQNQLAFKRERARMYAALAFERTR